MKKKLIAALAIPGSSGSAALDSSGRVVGVVSAVDGPITAIVSLADVQKFLKKF